MPSGVSSIAKDRERFLTLVREAMAKSIKNGEPLPAIRLRERPKQREEKTPPVRTPGDEGRSR